MTSSSLFQHFNMGFYNAYHHIPLSQFLSDSPQLLVSRHHIKDLQLHSPSKKHGFHPRHRRALSDGQSQRCTSDARKPRQKAIHIRIQSQSPCSANLHPPIIGTRPRDCEITKRTCRNEITKSKGDSFRQIRTQQSDIESQQKPQVGAKQHQQRY